MPNKIKSPCVGCGFGVLHDPEQRPADELICIDCHRRGFSLEHLAEQVAEEVVYQSGSDESVPDSKETDVTDTDTAQAKPAKKSTKKGKKASTKKATAAKATKPAEKATKAKKERKPASERRARGLLEADVKMITDKFLAGDLDLNKEPLTPHRIATLIKVEDDLDEAPSTGAVAAVLERWEKYGFALLDRKPTAFRRYTKAGEKNGLETTKEKYKTKRKAEKDAAKADA